MRKQRWCCSLLIGMCAAFPGCANEAARQANIEQAKAQVRRMAEDLDRRTTETGTYIRIKENEIKETDPWGTRIQVIYSQGGVAEMLVVRSAGPDRKFYTPDDIEATGMSANLKGIGEGVKKNAEQTAANAAKGVVKGTVAGVKESLKEAFSRKKPAKAAPGAETGNEPAQATVQKGKSP